jgi:fumarate hydratase, class I
MADLRRALVDLYRTAASSLPSDVEAALRRAREKEEKGSNAETALAAILENIRIARDTGRPLCQDTGVPIFFAKIPCGVSHLAVKSSIVRATRIASRNIPLRPNAVDVLTERNSGDNTGNGFPVVYCEETKGSSIVIDLMLKGAGSENIGQLYKLPMEEMGAERDLEGVRRCVLDAIYKAQGKGCPPYIIAVGIGASKDQVTRLSKEQLLRKIEDVNRHKMLSAFEKRILRDVNRLGIGPLGFGGKTTALGVKVGVNHRHPASYFVDVTISCWADRRAHLIWKLQSA